MTNAEAIKTLKLMQAQVEWDYPMEYAAAIDEAISALQAQEWIPCNPDTMPESNDEVLTTYIVNGNRKKRYVETATWYDDYEDGFWSSPLDEYRVKGAKIEHIAWKPMPESYKGE